MCLAASLVHFALLFLRPGPHVQQLCIGGSRSATASASVGAPATVLAVPPAPVLDPASDPATCPQVVMLRPLRLPQLARFACRETLGFSFTVASSVVSLVTVTVSCSQAPWQSLGL